MDARDADAIARWLEAETGAARAGISGLAKLSGGAIQENWAADIALHRAGGTERIEAVIRTDAPSGVSLSLSRADEFALFRAAFAAGVTAPEPLFLCTDRAVIGRPFFVMRRARGIAAGHKVVRDRALGGGPKALLAALGHELARIHSIAPPRADLSFLAPVERTPATDAIRRLRADLDGDPHAWPVIEYGLRRLELEAPDTDAVVLVHNDFRTGNFMADAGGVTAILDWEFAGWGDRHADLAWLCARCWRFGADEREAGGIGDRADFFAAYEAEAGVRLDPERIAWWELMAACRWATIAVAQAERHRSGREPRARPHRPHRAGARARHPRPHPRRLRPPALRRDRGMSGELPEPAGLVSIAAEVFRREILPHVPDGKRYEALMIANALATVVRQLAAERGGEVDPPAMLLAEAGGEVPGDAGGRAAALTTLIRAGALDPGRPGHGALRAFLVEAVTARLSVSNPKAAPPRPED